MKLPVKTRRAATNLLSRERFLLEGLEGRRLLSGSSIIQDGEVHPIPAYEMSVVSIKNADGIADADNIANPGDGIQSLVLANYYGFETTEFSVDDSGNMMMIADGVQYDVLTIRDMNYPADTDGADFAAEVIAGRTMTETSIQTGFAVRLNPETGWEIYQLYIPETPVEASGSGTSVVDEPEDNAAQAQVPAESDIVKVNGHAQVLEWQDVLTNLGDLGHVTICTFELPDGTVASEVSATAESNPQASESSAPPVAKPVVNSEANSASQAMPIAVTETPWSSRSFVGSFFFADDRRNQDEAPLDI